DHNATQRLQPDQPVAMGADRPHPGRRAPCPPAPEPAPQPRGRPVGRPRPAAPRGGNPVTLSVRNDRHYIRTSCRSNRFLVADLVAAMAVRRGSGRPPVNLAFVLDRSGSMSGPKISTARQAVEDAIARLSSEDRFAVVVYDDQIDIVAEGL